MSKAFEIKYDPSYKYTNWWCRRSSGNEGDVITLIRHTVEDQKLIFNAQIIGLIGLFKYEQNYIVLLKITAKFVL